MKILTHKFVIYDGGWRLEWEEKESMHITIPGREFILWCVVFYLLNQ